jgi:glutathione S-transferase
MLYSSHILSTDDESFAMKLYCTLTSPYARKVRVVLAEKKIECELVIENPRTNSAIAAYNPLARVPVLVLDDDTSIFDSPVIVEYLDNVAPNNKLTPQPNRERIEVKCREALADGLLDAAVAIRIETMRPAASQDASVIERNHLAIGRSLQAMELRLGDNTWFMGTHFGLADIAVGSALGYLNFRFPDVDWRPAQPNLTRLYNKLMLRPSFIDTAPPVGA